MKHEITIRLVKKQGYFTDRFVISAKNGDQAASAAENLAAMKYDGHDEVISYAIVGIHPITDEADKAAQAKKAAEAKKPAKSPGAKKFAKDRKPPKSRRINTVTARVTKPITEK